MKPNINRKNGTFFCWAAVMLIAASFIFTGCPNAAGGNASTNITGGGGTDTKYKVTLQQNPGGKVAVTPALPSDGMVSKNTVLTFTATPEKGYAIDTWTVTPTDAVQANTQNSRTVTVNANTAVAATFKTVPQPSAVDSAVLTVSSGTSDIWVKAKTADNSAITVEGCTEATFASDTETELHAKETTVTLKGKIISLQLIGDEKLTELNVQGLTALQMLECGGNQLTAQAFIDLLNNLPTRSDKGKCTLYIEEFSEGNHKDFTAPSELQTAFNNAKNNKHWELYKRDSDWNEVKL